MKASRPQRAGLVVAHIRGLQCNRPKIDYTLYKNGRGEECVIKAYRWHGEKMHRIYYDDFDD